MSVDLSSFPFKQYKEDITGIIEYYTPSAFEGRILKGFLAVYETEHEGMNYIRVVDIFPDEQKDSHEECFDGTSFYDDGNYYLVLFGEFCELQVDPTKVSSPVAYNGTPLKVTVVRERDRDSFIGGYVTMFRRGGLIAWRIENEVDPVAKDPLGGYRNQTKAIDKDQCETEREKLAYQYLVPPVKKSNEP